VEFSSFSVIHPHVFPCSLLRMVFFCIYGVFFFFFFFFRFPCVASSTVSLHVLLGCPRCYNRFSTALWYPSAILNIVSLFSFHPLFHFCVSYPRFSPQVPLRSVFVVLQVFPLSQTELSGLRRPPLAVCDHFSPLIEPFTQVLTGVLSRSPLMPAAWVFFPIPCCTTTSVVLWSPFFCAVPDAFLLALCFCTEGFSSYYRWSFRRR